MHLVKIRCVISNDRHCELERKDTIIVVNLGHMDFKHANKHLAQGTTELVHGKL